MLHSSQASALSSALLRLEIRDVDAEALINRARTLGVRLPVESLHGYSANLGRQQGRLTWLVPDERLPELRRLVDEITSSKRAA